MPLKDFADACDAVKARIIPTKNFIIQKKFHFFLNDYFQ